MGSCYTSYNKGHSAWCSEMTSRGRMVVVGGQVRVGQRLERKGAYLFLWMIHVVIWQKQTQHYKAIILQLKIKNFVFFILVQTAIFSNK